MDEPRVSQYRLAAHLSLAVVIYLYLLALALRFLDARSPSRRMPARADPVGRLAVAAGASVFVTLVMGAFVAGLKGGYVYPTFPKMGAFWVPPGMFEAAPWWSNVFDNPVTAQFVHRLLALVSFLLVVAAWAASLRAHVSRRVRAWALASLAAVAVQVTLGVSTVLLHVPVPLASGHQAGAIALLTCLVGLYLAARPPRLVPPSLTGHT